MKSKLLGLHVLLGLLVLTNCSFDDKVKIAKQYFEQKVNEDSKGAIKVLQFEKTNGTEKELMGQKIYEMEFRTTIETVKEIWKGGNSMEGHWSSFVVFEKEPAAGWNSYLAGDVKNYPQGMTFSMQGTITLGKSDNGWQVLSGFKILNVNESGISKEFRSNGKSGPIEINKLIGNWKTLDGRAELNIYKNGEDIMFTSSGEKNANNFEVHAGDKAIIKAGSVDFMVSITGENGGSVGYSMWYLPDVDHISINSTEYKRK